MIGGPTTTTGAVSMAAATARRLLAPRDWDHLGELLDLRHREPLTDLGDDLAREVLADVEVLVTGWGTPRVDEAVLEAAPKLRAIVHTGGTVRDFATDHVWRHGISVSTAVSANAAPVAEFTVAMILLSGKNVVQIARNFRHHRVPNGWRDRWPSTGNYLRTVGLLSASHVGRRVAELLRPYDLRVLLHDPFVPDDVVRGLGAEPVGLDDLFRRSDIVSIHAPLLPETTGLVDARRLSLLPDGATLINTARGPVVDTAALEAEVSAGRLSAVLDVTDPEPLPPGSSLWTSDDVLLTPHLAGSAGGELRRLVECALSEVEQWTLTGGFRFPVDPGTLGRQA